MSQYSTLENESQPQRHGTAPPAVLGIALWKMKANRNTFAHGAIAPEV